MSVLYESIAAFQNYVLDRIYRYRMRSKEYTLYHFVQEDTYLSLHLENPIL